MGSAGTMTVELAIEVEAQYSLLLLFFFLFFFCAHWVVALLEPHMVASPRLMGKLPCMCWNNPPVKADDSLRNVVMMNTGLGTEGIGWVRADTSEHCLYCPFTFGEKFEQLSEHFECFNFTSGDGRMLALSCFCLPLLFRGTQLCKLLLPYSERVNAYFLGWKWVCAIS